MGNCGWVHPCCSHRLVLGCCALLWVVEMSSININEPAFPLLAEQTQDGWAHTGMTLRDYFAAKAMQAMLSSPNCPMKLEESELAAQSYMTADAMLKARES